MPAYRNRSDRRPAPPQLTASPIVPPVLTFVGTDAGLNIFRLTFNEPIIPVDLTDPDVLNSIRTWSPSDDFEGTATSAVIHDASSIDVTFDTTPAAGNIAAVWIFDQRHDFRGASTGAACTGNPTLIEAV